MELHAAKASLKEIKIQVLENGISVRTEIRHLLNDDLQEAMDLFEAVIRVGRQRTAVQRIRQAALIQALLTDEVTG